jgi:hypothetical protein
MVVEKSQEYKTIHIVFIDLAKAFDSIPRKKPFEVLAKEYGITGKLLLAIKSMFNIC